MIVELFLRRLEIALIDPTTLDVIAICVAFIALFFVAVTVLAVAYYVIGFGVTLVERASTTICPACHERVKRAARKCKHCHEWSARISP